MKKALRKKFDLKGDLEENHLRVVASAMGVMDRGGDVIMPGAFQKVLKGFLKNGFVAIGHDWDDLPVAMPVEAFEDGQSLISTAEFHSTVRAQEARTVCKERLEKGLSVSLSIGFMPGYAKGVHQFSSGEDLFAWAQGAGFDLKLLDAAGIRKWKGYCRAITETDELFEWSIVCVPQNNGARDAAVKAYLKAAGIEYEPEIFSEGAPVDPAAEIVNRSAQLRGLSLQLRALDLSGLDLFGRAVSE